MFGRTSKREKYELKTKKKELSYGQEKRRRDVEIGRLKSQASLLKARENVKRLKKGKAKPRPLFDITVGKKKQGKKLSRKSKIRIV